MSSATEKYIIYCDMDGVLTDFEGQAIIAMNKKMRTISKNVEVYRHQQPKIFKIAKKAAEQQDGDLDNGIPGMPFTIKDIVKGGSAEKKRVRDFMYLLLSNDFEFWSNLSWMPGGKKLWNYIKKFNPTILSSPMTGINSKQGKIYWAKKNLRIGDNNIILTKDKYLYAKLGDKIGVLIDDMPKYVIPFQEAGGIAIRHIDTDSTIEALRKLGF